MRKVAVTGGLSSGKSTVCRLLKDKGAYCVSADEIVHQLLTTTTPTGKKILELFGDGILKGEAFDKKKIAQVVFKDKEQLKALEHILHPAVLDQVEQEYNKIKESKNTPLFVAEIPLLYEIESAHLFDKVVAVIADEDIAKQRYQENFKENFEERMTHQMPIEEKCAKADFVIENNGDLAALKQVVDTLYNQLTE